MKYIHFLVLSSILAFPACKTRPPDTSETNILNISTTPAPKTGMVASANPHATKAGLEILRAGGSAVDAAIAIQTTLGLVEPQSSGLGGGAFMIVYDPETASIVTYDGRETAPAGVTPDMFLNPDTGEPLRYFDGITSGRSTGVPGAMVMLHAAHNDHGKLDWSASFEPAIKLADDGFKVSPRLASLVARFGRFGLINDPDARDYFFLEDGSPVPEDFLRDNPAYANTLRALQANPRALLEGPIAEAIIAKTRREPLPGTMTLDDMATYQPFKKQAVCSTYRAHTVCGPRPPSSGGIAVQATLGILENFDMAKLGPTIQGWHHFIEASFLAYADRDRYVADEDFVDVPIAAMLDKDYLKSRAALISTDKAIPRVTAGTPAKFPGRGTDATPDAPGTSHFTVVDSNGLTVSMTTTIEGIFGSQRMTNGFMLNNQLTDFSFRVVDNQGRLIANAPAPGKRPRSSMSPHIIFDPDGKLLFTTGSPGGNAIIAYTSKSIIGIIDWGLSPQEAIELPNVIARNGSVRMEASGLGNEDTNESVRTGPAAEFGMSPDVVAGLEALRHEVVKSRGEISGLHIIYRNRDGTLIGGADPRREGTAEKQ
ncbi:MAG: gamma-glutamyltransferase family protein [Hyphomonadaceae bacterium]|nr:gamma-glutamyltransferase family protein [Hyphomonadaceae bacterium]